MGSSHATALTCATSSGGKTARATDPRLIPQTLKSLFAESSSPPTDRLSAHPQTDPDLGVGLAFRRHQHELGPLHLKMGPRVAGGDVLKLDSLGLAQHHIVGAPSRHRHTSSPPSPSPLQARWDLRRAALSCHRSSSPRSDRTRTPRLKLGDPRSPNVPRTGGHHDAWSACLSGTTQLPLHYRGAGVRRASAGTPGTRPAREPGSTPSQLSLLDLDTEAPVQCARRLLSDETPANRRSRSPLLAQNTSASTFWLDLVRPCMRATSTSRMYRCTSLTLV